MKFFISGKVTNGNTLDCEQMRKNIALGIEYTLILCDLGHSVYSPFFHAFEFIRLNMSQEEIMDICFEQVRKADACYFLPNYEESEGSKREHALAKELGKVIFYEIGDIPCIRCHLPNYDCECE